MHILNAHSSTCRGWKLTHILNTHHHGDHVGANLALKVGSAAESVRGKGRGGGGALEPTWQSSRGNGECAGWGGGGGGVPES